MMPRGPEQELQWCLCSAQNVTSCEIRVEPFKSIGREDVPRKNKVPKAGGKTFHLRLNPFCHVYAAAIRHMAIGPRRLRFAWCARVIE
jgi:hypothetical protein